MFAQLAKWVEMRPLLPTHAPELAECVSRYRDHLTQWTVLASRVADVDSARDLLESYAAPPRYFGIWRESQLVGGALFRTYDAKAGVCEVGGWLTPQAEGRGLITRAFRQLIDRATGEGISRIELRSSPDNHRARAIAQRLGMSLEATLRQSFRLNGVWHDTEVWALAKGTQLLQDEDHGAGQAEKGNTRSVPTQIREQGQMLRLAKATMGQLASLFSSASMVFPAAWLGRALAGAVLLR